MEKQDKTHTTTFTHDARFYAQPYDMDARGFFFVDAVDYESKRNACRNAYGDEVEEFEIQFIDGNDLDAAMFEALGINQATILPFINKLDEWDDDNKTKLIIAVGEGGYSFDIAHDNPDDFEVDLYADMTLKDLAYQFVDDGLFGDIPERLSYYLDYDAIARDLAHDYAETSICGDNYVYRLA